jgi:hypothetical protein
VKDIASKLVLIMGECDYVQKGGVNKFHNYKYAAAADVLEKVNAACVKHNVASIVSSKIVDVSEVTTSRGNKERLVTVETTLRIIDGDSGEEVTAAALGTGQDPGDKAVAKAQTMALKYAWMTTLNISTGDDPEADESVDQRNAETKKPASTPPSKPPPDPMQGVVTPKLATEPQRKRLFALSKKAGLEQADLKLLVEQLTGKTSTADLTSEDIQKCFADLEVIIRAKDSKQEEIPNE